MPRTPAKITQADVARAIRAAKQAGAAGIEIAPDGRIRVLLTPAEPSTADDTPLAPQPEIVL